MRKLILRLIIKYNQRCERRLKQTNKLIAEVNRKQMLLNELEKERDYLMSKTIL
mgnify:CR=1